MMPVHQSQRTLDRHKWGRLHMSPPVDLNSGKVSVPVFFIVFFLFLKPTARSKYSVEVLLAVGLRERKAEKLPRCFSLLLAKLN